MRMEWVGSVVLWLKSNMTQHAHTRAHALCRLTGRTSFVQGTALRAHPQHQRRHTLRASMIRMWSLKWKIRGHLGSLWGGNHTFLIRWPHVCVVRRMRAGCGGVNEVHLVKMLEISLQIKGVVQGRYQIQLRLNHSAASRAKRWTRQPSYWKREPVISQGSDGRDWGSTDLSKAWLANVCYLSERLYFDMSLETQGILKEEYNLHSYFIIRYLRRYYWIDLYLWWDR